MREPRLKIISREKAAETSRQIRLRNRVLVFTNGCFDILHPGHIELLTRARAMGDALMVGLNTDESVRRLKGPSRPLLDERSRAIMLAALEAVDWVVLFDEDTPEQLIGEVLPKVLVKGGDYTIDTVVGRDIVESHGGKVVIVPLVAGHSTSLLIGRLMGMGPP